MITNVPRECNMLVIEEAGGREEDSKKNLWELSIFSAQFSFCKPITALRNSLLIPKRNTQPSMARPGEAGASALLMALPGLEVLQRTVCRCSTLPEKVQTLRANIHPEKDRTENKSSSVTYLLSFCE